MFANLFVTSKSLKARKRESRSSLLSILTREINSQKVYFFNVAIEMLEIELKIGNVQKKKKEKEQKRRKKLKEMFLQK